ncbi:MAG: sulfite exporter TauE/SafE family protein [Aestuariivita sp.]|nr:sulfite exporter TauE/SafE family protein [Aestuariivita sp.]
MDVITLFLAASITVFAGIIKGAVGFAMPLIMISGLSVIADPKLAIAAIIFPTLLSNGFQTFRNGLKQALSAIIEFWRYLLITCVLIAITAQSIILIPKEVLYLLLGIPVVTISAIQFLGLELKISPTSRKWADWVAGSITGILGGLSATWGPPTVLYLLAIEIPKHRQIVAQGVIYGFGSIVFLLAHLQSGLLDAVTAPLSALLIIPAFLGMWLGIRLQDRMDYTLFRKVTFAVLFVAGMNLFRKGIFG